jgi:hypothetical protein
MIDSIANPVIIRAKLIKINSQACKGYGLETARE